MWDMLDRYADLDIAYVWSRGQQIQLWRDIEVSYLGATAGRDAARRSYLSYLPTVSEVDALEAVNGHEVAAFLDIWIPQLPEDLQSYAHLGLTSSDLVDTAFAVQMDRSYHVLEEALGDAHNALIATAARLETVVGVSRTHGQQATARPAAHPWAVFVEMWERECVRIGAAADEATVGKLSGPDGTSETIPPEIEARVLAEFGLTSVASTQIVPRDLHAELAHRLAAVCTLVEAVATNLRLHAITEVDEFAEQYAKDRVGSTAMPHKRNPARCERLCGFGRMARGMAHAIEESVIQWWDRDLAHSAPERALIPDLFHLAATGCWTLSAVLNGGQWHTQRMDALSSLVPNSERKLADAMKNGTSWPEAHRALRS